MGIIIANDIWCILRMIVASCCGILIGFERKNRSKEAGVRTHCIVACASALMMILSKYAFGDVTAGEMGMRGADGARIAAQVVSGVGFLGAGMIFVHKNTITGLTTAAGIWATAGVGMAIGAGMYVIGISASLLIVFMQIFLHKNFKWLKTPKSKKIVVKEVNVLGFQKEMTETFKNMGIHVHDVYIEKNEHGCNYTFVVEIPDSVCEEEIVSAIDYKCKIAASS